MVKRLFGTKRLLATWILFAVTTCASIIYGVITASWLGALILTFIGPVSILVLQKQESGNLRVLQRVQQVEKRQMRAEKSVAKNSEEVLSKNQFALGRLERELSKLNAGVLAATSASKPSENFLKLSADNQDSQVDSAATSGAEGSELFNKIGQLMAEREADLLDFLIRTIAVGQGDAEEGITPTQQVSISSICKEFDLQRPIYLGIKPGESSCRQRFYSDLNSLRSEAEFADLVVTDSALHLDLDALVMHFPDAVLAVVSKDGKIDHNFVENSSYAEVLPSCITYGVRTFFPKTYLS